MGDTPRNIDERTAAGITADSPRVLLRIEGAVLLAMSLFMYSRYGRTWWLFAILLLAPDIGMLGYLASARIGAATYNVFHTYFGPAALSIVGIAVDRPAIYSIGFIWFAHIGLDRALGYGLKYSDGFQHTHLGMIGRAADRRNA